MRAQGPPARRLTGDNRLHLRYLLDAQRLLDDAPTALEFFHAMLDMYPELLNPGALWSGTTTPLPSSRASPAT